MSLELAATESALDQETERRAERLARFRGPLVHEDQDSAEFWRGQSAEAHAKAMVDLSNYATRMAAQTGLGRDATEPLPALPAMRSSRDVAR